MLRASPVHAATTAVGGCSRSCCSARPFGPTEFAASKSSFEAARKGRGLRGSLRRLAICPRTSHAACAWRGSASSRLRREGICSLLAASRWPPRPRPLWEGPPSSATQQRSPRSNRDRRPVRRQPAVQEGREGSPLRAPRRFARPNADPRMACFGGTRVVCSLARGGYRNLAPAGDGETVSRAERHF